MVNVHPIQCNKLNKLKYCNKLNKYSNLFECVGDNSEHQFHNIKITLPMKSTYYIMQFKPKVHIVMEMNLDLNLILTHTLPLKHSEWQPGQCVFCGSGYPKKCRITS